MYRWPSPALIETSETYNGWLCESAFFNAAASSTTLVQQEGMNTYDPSIEVPGTHLRC